MIYLVLIILLNCKVHLEAIDYCEVDRSHLLCRKPEPCDRVKKLDTVNESEEQSLIDHLNRIRRKAAEGRLEFKDGKNKKLKSSKMNVMKWDSTLEKMAKIHVRSCNYGKYHQTQTLIGKFQSKAVVALWIPSKIELAKPTNYKWDKVLEIEKRKLENAFLLTDLPNARNMSVIPFVDTIKDIISDMSIRNILFLLRDEHYLIGCSSSGYKYRQITLHFFICYLGPIEPQKSRDLWTAVGEGASSCPKRVSPKYSVLCSTDEFPNAVNYNGLPIDVTLPPGTTKRSAKTTTEEYYDCSLTASIHKSCLYSVALCLLCLLYYGY